MTLFKNNSSDVVTYVNFYNTNSLTNVSYMASSINNMSSTYQSCYNLTGSPVCGSNVTNMGYTYYDCPSLDSNGYFYSNKITNIRSCFEGKNNSKMLNLYVPANSTTLTTCLYSKTSSLVGNTITWTNDTTNNRYYNTTYNIYIYPVDNVEQARQANGD